MTNKAIFNHLGITIPTQNGSVILNAGQNMSIFPQGDMITFSAQIPSNVMINSQTAYQPPKSIDVLAVNGSIYYSTTLNKLAFKDFSGTVHALY